MKIQVLQVLLSGKTVEEQQEKQNTTVITPTAVPTPVTNTITNEVKKVNESIKKVK